MTNLQKVYALVIDQDDVDGEYIGGIYSSRVKAADAQEKIIAEYIHYCEQYNATREDALAYYNFEIREFILDK